MFNKYWREYPIFLQLVLLILMIFITASAAYAAAGLLTPLLTGVPLVEAVNVTPESSSKAIFASKVFSLISNLASFGGAGFLYAYASHPRKWEYLGFRKVEKPALVFISLVMVLAAMPLILQLAEWLKQLDFNPAANEAQQRAEQLISAYLKNDSVGGLLFTLIVLALVPALGEEMFFRGVVLRMLHKQTKNVHFAVFMSGAIFAFFHMQPYNMPSILVMGMLLGYTYYYSGSLWASVAVHFIHNGLQVVLSYFAATKAIPADIEQMESFPWYVLVTGAALSALSFYLLQKNASPLPPGWSNDFSREETAERLRQKE